jgi:hypothetical protein
MDASDALAVLQQQHADFEDDKLTSEDPDFTIVIESQQKELEKHIVFLENAAQAREIAQVDLRNLRIIDDVRVQEQQALDDRRFAARQAGRVLDLTSVQTRMREGEAVVGHFSPAYIRAASQPLLVGRERFLSEDTLRVRTSPASPVNIILEPEQGEPISHTLEEAGRGDGARERPVTTLGSLSHGLSPISAEGTSNLVQLAGNATSVKERSHDKNLTTMKLGPNPALLAVRIQSRSEDLIWNAVTPTARHVWSFWSS